MPNFNQEKESIHLVDEIVKPLEPNFEEQMDNTLDAVGNFDGE